MINTLIRHSKIIGALTVREMNTRFGREGLGFAWIIGEPLLFCFGVLLLWTLTKPEFEHGIRLAPFVLTGYMSLILLRHLVGYMSAALQANQGLLYHRQITAVHIFSARAILEIGGTTAAFITAYLVLLALQQVSLPSNYLILYGGWFLLAFMGVGFALVLAGLAMRYEAFERVIGLISYLLVPLSGAFLMVGWLPPAYQQVMLYIPFVHGIEMVRAGVFNEFTETHYNFGYALAWAAAFNCLGLILISGARDRLSGE